MKKLFILAVLGMQAILSAQNFEIKQRVIDYQNQIKYADQEFEDGKFLSALEYYQAVLKEDPTDEYTLLRTGMCFYHLNHFDSCLIHLEKIHPPFKDDQMQFDYHYYMGENEVRLGNYKEAHKLYGLLGKLFLPEERGGPEFKKYRERAKIIKKLSKGQIRQDTSDIVALLMPTEEGNVFNPYLQDSSFFFYKRDDGLKEYQFDFATDNASKQITTIKDSLSYWNSSFTINRDSTFIFYVKTILYEDGWKQSQLFFAEYSDTALVNEKALPFPINGDDFNTTHPQYLVLQGKEYILYSSNGPNGKGGYDLWLVQIKKGTFSRPKNLTKLNTPGDEITPNFNDIRGEVTYSSNHKYNIGGFDIFSAASNNVKRTAKPIRLDYPFNSEYDDYYYKSYQDSTFVFVSNRNPKECCGEIYYNYRPYTPPVKETIEMCPKETELMADLDLTLYFGNDMPNPGSRDTTTSDNYIATFLQYQEAVPTYVKKFKKADKGADTIWTNYFDNQVKNGMENLKQFNQKLLTELQKGNAITIAVKAYANSFGEADYNTLLTKRRIQTFFNQIEEYENGVFKPFLDNSATNGGRLKINRLPFGEAEGTDEDVHPYSTEAASERRIEIVSAISKRTGVWLDSTITHTVEISRKRSKAFKRAINFSNGYQDAIEIEAVTVLDSDEVRVLDYPEKIAGCGQGFVILKIATQDTKKIDMSVKLKDKPAYIVTLDIEITD